MRRVHYIHTYVWWFSTYQQSFVLATSRTRENSDTNIYFKSAIANFLYFGKCNSIFNETRNYVHQLIPAQGTEPWTGTKNRLCFPFISQKSGASFPANKVSKPALLRNSQQILTTIHTALSPVKQELHVLTKMELLSHSPFEHGLRLKLGLLHSLHSLYYPFSVYFIHRVLFRLRFDFAIPPFAVFWQESYLAALCSGIIEGSEFLELFYFVNFISGNFAMGNKSFEKLNFHMIDQRPDTYYFIQDYDDKQQPFVNFYLFANNKRINC